MDPEKRLLLAVREDLHRLFHLGDADCGEDVRRALDRVPHVDQAEHLPVQVDDDARRGGTRVDIRRDPLEVEVRQVDHRAVAGHGAVADRPVLAGGTADRDDGPSDQRLRAGGSHLDDLQVRDGVLRHLLMADGEDREPADRVFALDLRRGLRPIRKGHLQPLRLQDVRAAAQDQRLFPVVGDDHAARPAARLIRVIEPVVVRRDPGDADHGLRGRPRHFGQRAIQLTVRRDVRALVPQHFLHDLLDLADSRAARCLRCRNRIRDLRSSFRFTAALSGTARGPAVSRFICRLSGILRVACCRIARSALRLTLFRALLRGDELLQRRLFLRRLLRERDLREGLLRVHHLIEDRLQAEEDEARDDTEQHCEEKRDQRPPQQPPPVHRALLDLLRQEICIILSRRCPVRIAGSVLFPAVRHLFLPPERAALQKPADNQG